MAFRSALKWPFTQQGLTVVGLLVAIAFGLQQWWVRDYKSITCRLVSKRPLITKGPDEAANDLQISFKNTPVVNPWTITLALENSGNVPILKEDVEESVTVDLGDAKVLSSSVSKTIPSNLRASVTHAADAILVQHQLFNPGDVIFASLITEGEPQRITIQGRIAGIFEPLFTEELEDAAGERSQLAEWGAIFATGCLYVFTILVGAFCLLAPAIGIEWLYKAWNAKPPSTSSYMSSVERSISRHHVQPRDDHTGLVLKLSFLPALRWLDERPKIKAALIHQLGPDGTVANLTVDEACQAIVSLIKTDLKRIAMDAADDYRFPTRSKVIVSNIEEMQFETIAEFRQQLEYCCNDNLTDIDGFVFLRQLKHGLPSFLKTLVMAGFLVLVAVSFWYLHLGY